MRRVRSIGKRNNHRVPTKMFTGKEAFVESKQSHAAIGVPPPKKATAMQLKHGELLSAGRWVRTHWTLRCIIIGTRGVDGVQALKITHPW
jgi:hypothetical protein